MSVLNEVGEDDNSSSSSSSKSKRDFRWLCVFFCANMLNWVCGAAVATVFGPAQPYLAERIGVDIDSVNWIWTFSGYSGIVGHLSSSFTFKQYITRPLHKLLVFAGCNVFHAVFVYSFASHASFASLIGAIVVMNFASGYGGAGSGGMMVYTMGPDRSRALVMAHHFLVGVGFLIGPFVIGRHFPHNNDDDIHLYRQVCHLGNSSDGASDNNNTSSSGGAKNELLDLDAPFHELGVAAAVISLLYLLPLLLPGEMPVHEDFAEELRMKQKGVQSSSSSISAFPATPRRNLTLFLAAVYYCAICSNERVFQSMQFTFGLCGPLKLSPRDAVFIDKMYNGGFMVGRMLSVPATLLFPPKLMLKLCVPFCLLISSAVAVSAAADRDLFYVLCFVYGTSIAWQFGSMYSWLAAHMDLVGARNAVFSLGCGSASLAPLAAGYLFTHVGPMSIWRFNLGLAVVQAATAVYLVAVFRKKENSSGEQTKAGGDVKYERLAQDEEEEEEEDRGGADELAEGEVEDLNLTVTS